MATRGVDPERPLCPCRCGCPVPAGSLMCAPCWRETSPTSRVIWRRAWDHWLAHGGQDAWRAYMDARHTIITEVGTRPRCRS